MSDMEQERKGIIALYGVNALLTVAVIVMLAILSSCTRTVYEPVETVRIEYRDREVERLVADTVHDTRFVWVKGDTVVDIREKEHVKRIEIHDTCYVEHSDTIRIPYPVERTLSKWERTKMDFGGMAIGGIAIAVCVAVIWLIKKIRRK